MKEEFYANEAKGKTYREGKRQKKGPGRKAELNGKRKQMWGGAPEEKSEWIPGIKGQG